MNDFWPVEFTVCKCETFSSFVLPFRFLKLNTSAQCKFRFKCILKNKSGNSWGSEVKHIAGCLFQISNLNWAFWWSSQAGDDWWSDRVLRVSRLVSVISFLARSSASLQPGPGTSCLCSCRNRPHLPWKILFWEFSLTHFLPPPHHTSQSEEVNSQTYKKFQKVFQIWSMCVGFFSLCGFFFERKKKIFLYSVKFCTQQQWEDTPRPCNI